jgi:excisionase family DNA binding protein
MTTNPEFMTVDEVAELLTVSPATVRYWRQFRTGPRSFKLGGSVRYRRADVLAWLEDQEAESAREATP